jgi:hypothetical protein
MDSPKVGNDSQFAFLLNFDGKATGAEVEFWYN